MLRLRQPVPSAALLAVFLLQSTLALAQQAPAGQGIGVVTSLQGQATVGRQALPQPAPLRFKDDVFFRDRIATREKSTVRLLLGGKGTLTIREQSQVTLDESVAPDGTRRSVVGLLTGKIGAAIARGLMRPGDVIEIQTPNAVAAVRGTVLIAEYVPPPGSAEGPKPVLLASAAPGPILAQAQGGAGGTSNFFVVSGQVTITPQGQPPLTLGPLQAVNVTATPTGAQAGSIQNVTPAQINDAAQGLQTGNPHTGEAEASRTAQAQAQIAAAVANAITGVTPPAAQDGGVQQQGGPPNNTVTPVTPEVPVAPPTTENILPAGSLLTLNNAALGLAEGTSLATFQGGVANAVNPQQFQGGVSVVTDPILTVTGDTITHVGTIVSLENGAAIVGAPTDTITPVANIGGTNLTNTGGHVFTLTGESVLTTFAPLLNLQEGATATLAGIMAIGGDSAVALGPASAVMIPNGTTLTLTAPGFDLMGASQLNTFAGAEGPGHLVALSSGTLILQAPLLRLTPGPDEGAPIVDIAGDVLHIASSVTGPPNDPLVVVEAGSLTVGGDVVDLGADATLTLSAPVLTIAGGEVAASNVLNVGAPLTTPAGQPVIAVTGSSLSTTGSLATLGANLTLGGPLLAQSAGDVTTGADALVVGSHTLTTGPAPVFALTGGTLTTENTSHLVSLAGGTANLGGPLLVLAPGLGESTPTVNIGGDVLHVASTVTGPPIGSLITVGAGSLMVGEDVVNLAAGSTMTLTQGLLAINGGGVSAGGSVLRAVDSILTIGTLSPLVSVGNGGSLTTGGPVLDLTNSPLNLGGQAVVTLAGGSSLANTVGPVVKISGGSLTADVLGLTDGAANTIALNGSLLDLTDTTVILRAMGDDPAESTDTFTHSLAAGEPAVRMANSNLTLTGAGVALAHPEADTPGVALIATNTSGETRTLSLAGPALRVNDAINLTSTDPQIQLSQMTVNQTGLNRLITVDNVPVTVNGPLLFSVESTINAAGLLHVAGGDLTSHAASPAFDLTGGSLTLGGGAPAIAVNSSASFDESLLLATNSSLVLGAPFLSLAGEGSSLTVGGDVLGLAGTSTLTGPPAGSLVGVEGGILTATGDLVNLGAGSSLVLNDSVLTVAGGDVAVNNVLNVGAPLSTPAGPPAIAVTGSSLSTTGSLATLGANLTLGGPLLAQSAGDVTTGADALVVGSHTLTTGPAPVFALSGGTLTTAEGAHLVSLAGGTANLGGPLLALAPGPGEITPTVNIGGDVLHVASTVTGPPGGNVISATAGRLTSGGDFFHIAPGGTMSVSGSLVAASDSILAAATSVPGGGSGVPALWEPNFGSLVTNGRCDDCTTGVPGVELGFSFPFQGQNFTHAVVSGNGFLWLGGDQGSQCCNPSVPTFLTGLGRVSVGWTDWDPRFGDGGVRANILPGRAVFTWDGVPEYPGGSNPNSRFQIQLLADGRIIFGYETLHPLTGHDLLIGVTPGGGAADPGEVHFLTAVPLSTGSTGTVYEVFTMGESTGLDGVALVFTPNGSGGWDVSTTGSPLGGLGGAVLTILDGGQLLQSGNAALFDLLRTPLTSGGDFLRMLGQSLLSLTGRLLNATDSSIALTRSVVNILGGGQIVSTTPDSLVRTTGGSLTMAGLTSTPFEGGTLNFTTGSFLQMSSPNPDAMASLTLAGGLLHSSGTEITALNHFLDIGSNAHVTSTGADPAVVLENSPLTIAGLGSFTIDGETESSPFGNFLNICCTNSMTLTGPLLVATDSPLTVAGALVSVFGGGRLTSTTTDSLVKLVGETHEIGAGTFSGEIQIGPQVFAMPASLLDLRGITMDEAGLGTDPVLQTGGTVFEANGATVNLAGSGNAISIDTALLAAAAPIVKLINSTLNTSADGDPVGGAMRLFQSTVTSLGPVFNLDNSVLTVQSGPLLSLTGGSNLTVTGDFTSLINGSRLTVVNGPLIFVDGINGQGTPSTLTVTGGVVNFGGTGGNQVIVTNAIAPTAVSSGLPVNVGGGGSSITIGPNPIKNPALGTVTINGVLAGPGPHTGSLIQATNGGQVTISAP